MENKYLSIKVSRGLFTTCQRLSALGIVVRVDRLAVLPVELKVEACVQLFFRVLAQVDPSAFAFLQRGLQAVFAPVLLRDKTDAEIRDGICAAVYHGDLHGILLCTAGGKAQAKQQR